MSRFATTPRLSFGRRPAVAGDTVPPPKLRRAAARRHVQLREAAEVLTCIPSPGESLHAVMNGRWDLCHWLVVLIGRLCIVDVLRIATLSWNENNVVELLRLLDTGAVRQLSMLSSSFHKSHYPGLFTETREQLRRRGARLAACRSHMKLVTMALPDGRRFVAESSANLRTNSNLEFVTLYCDPDLHDHWAAFIDQLVSRHEGDADE